MDSQNQNQSAPVSNEPVQDNKLMAILAYIGPLVIVSYVTSKSDEFVKYHIKQGAVLFIIEVAMWFVGMMMPLIWMIMWIVNLFVLVLSIIGIINVVNGQKKELPIVGKYSSNINI